MTMRLLLNAPLALLPALFVAALVSLPRNAPWVASLDGLSFTDDEIARDLVDGFERRDG